MDQDSFRQLLSTSSSTSTRHKRESLFSNRHLSQSSSQQPNSSATFKPRKVKKQPDKYRDRASERRSGLDNDFAQVEAVLEDFEKRNKDNEDYLAIEEQRKYLGGDSDHSVLVKGLDFALLEQNKAKAAAVSAIEDDEFLEQAFLGTIAESNTNNEPATTVVPKKRTRQDLVRELKEKRDAAGPVVTEEKEKEISIEEAKKIGKFKPIGFKPVAEEKAGKKKKQEKDAGRKRKKSKVNSAEQVKSAESERPPPVLIPEPSQTVEPAAPVNEQKLEPEPKPEPIVDIFAGVEDYTGLDIDDDDEVGSEREVDQPSEPVQQLASSSRGWFDEPKEPTPSTAPELEPPLKPTKAAEAADAEEDEQPSMRLVPLASSAIPSVRDVLAMDEAVEKAEKRKARKEKRKDKKALTAEGKANKDYQKLMAYEKKKSK